MLIYDRRRLQLVKRSFSFQHQYWKEAVFFVVDGGFFRFVLWLHVFFFDLL